MSTVFYYLWVNEDLSDQNAMDMLDKALRALPGYVEHSFEDVVDA